MPSSTRSDGPDAAAIDAWAFGGVEEAAARAPVRRTGAPPAAAGAPRRFTGTAGESPTRWPSAGGMRAVGGATREGARESAAARTAGPGRPALFLDRDGVLNRLLPGAYVTHWGLFEWLPGARDALRLARARGWPCIVVTNQAGVGKGLQSQDELDAVHARMRADAARAGGAIAAVYACPHAPEAGCACRKPRPGLLLRAAADLGLDLGRSWMIGDSRADLAAAEAAGVRWLLVRTGSGEDTARGEPTARADRVFADVREAVRAIGRAPQAEQPG